MDSVCCRFVPGTKLILSPIRSYTCTPAFKQHASNITASISCLAPDYVFLHHIVIVIDLHLKSIRWPSSCQLCAWHKVDRQGTPLHDAARTRRAWSEGRERERTPKRPDGEAVPPMSCVGAGSSEPTPPTLLGNQDGSYPIHLPRLEIRLDL